MTMLIHDALKLINSNARDYAGSNPTLATLLAEVAELAYALEARHEDPPALELVQIGGIVVNMLTAYDYNATLEAFTSRNRRKLAQ